MRSIISAISAMAVAGMLGMTLLGDAPVQAQETKPAHGTGPAQKGAHNTKASHPHYQCAHCKIVTTKAGSCPACKMKMTKISAASARKAQTQTQFECAHCQLRSAKGGKCPMCKIPMKKVAKPAKSS